jgi:hypothetical protein
LQSCGQFPESSGSAEPQLVIPINNHHIDPLKEVGRATLRTQDPTGYQNRLIPGELGLGLDRITNLPGVQFWIHKPNHERGYVKHTIVADRCFPKWEILAECLHDTVGCTANSCRDRRRSAIG